MSDSPKSPNAKVEREIVVQNKNRLCDFCGEYLALLYCRADSAKLCLSCDRQVHSSNLLFAKHTRSQLCDACDSSPASILCSTHNFVFCQNCDWETHNHNHNHNHNLNQNESSPSIHDRRPLEGFTGCPSVAELLSILGFGDVDHKTLFGDEGVYGDFGDGFSDLFGWDPSSVFSLDDLIGSTDTDHNFQAIGVPPPPKNRNVASGQYKEEFLRQLGELAKLEPDFSDGHGFVEPLKGFQSFLVPEARDPSDVYLDFGNDAEPFDVPSLEATEIKWGSDTAELANQDCQPKLFESYAEEHCRVPEKDSDNGGNANGDNEGQSNLHIATEAVQVLPKVVITRELASQERDTALSRYKEKKKTRRYDKTIRYESRKVRADCRKRVNGRFAKMDNTS